MKQKKIKILIGILLALLMFASSVALLMYTKHQKISADVSSRVEAFVSTRTIKKGEKITAKDIVGSMFLKEHISANPLVKEEIVGRYANVNIYKNEPIRVEKITTEFVSTVETVKENFTVEKMPVDEVLIQEVEREESSYDTITLPLNLFKNLDTSLKQGDYIDIVSIEPKRVSRDETTFVTKYLALRVNIHAFVYNSNFVQNVIAAKDEKSGMPILSSSVVLKMSPLEIQKLLPIYYKTQDLNSKRVYASKDNAGHLWMVKCSEVLDENSQIQKEKMLAGVKVKPKRTYRPRVKKDTLDISYEH